MKKKILLITTIVCFATAGFSQTPNRTPEEKRRDSVQLIDIKKKYPDNFRFNIVPITLTDNSLYVPGFMSGIRFENNIIADSIHRNYHADMPDTSSVIPYASLTVIGQKVNIQFLQYGFFTFGNKAAKNYIEAITSTTGIQKEFLPKKEQESFFNKRSIRISINGKPLFNWKKVADFKRQLCKIGSYENSSQSMYSYEYVFSLCDTSLAINDQLFIEIKEDSTNQMVDSYNITRKAATPKVSLFLSDKKDYTALRLKANESGEKKTLR